MPEKLQIEKTFNTPSILLDADAGLIEIKGSSYPEESTSLYTPVFEWIGQYLLHPRDTTINIELEYFNTASAKHLLTIFKSLAVISTKNYMLNINWYYMEDDEDVMDSGESFAKLSELKFNMIAKKWDGNV